MLTMTEPAPLTVAEVAQRENISKDTVKRAIKNGWLRAHKVGSRGDWRIAFADYRAWMDAGALTRPAKPTQEPTP